jgi:ribosomal protein S27AE
MAGEDKQTVYMAYHQTEAQSETLYAVYATKEDAERDIFILKAMHSSHFAEGRWRIYPMPVLTVSTQAQAEAQTFQNYIDQFGWSHEFKDDPGFGKIKARKTCAKCGASVIMYTDGAVEEVGDTAQRCGGE